MANRDQITKKVCGNVGKFFGAVGAVAVGTVGGGVMAAIDLAEGKSLKEAGKNWSETFDEVFEEGVDAGEELGEKYGPKVVKGAEVVGKAYLSYRTYKNYKKSEEMLAQSQEQQKRLNGGS